MKKNDIITKLEQENHSLKKEVNFLRKRKNAFKENAAYLISN